MENNMKIKLRIIIVAMLCIGALALAACGGNDTPSLINTSTADQVTTPTPADITPEQSTPVAVESTTAQPMQTTAETTTSAPAAVTTPAETTDPAAAGWSDFH